ncbi:Venom serine carboxypeptidase [Gryllus bimaculatus]|nr:Venom serine carboxypeptidase [Gryllus bimaculatus]
MPSNLRRSIHNPSGENEKSGMRNHNPRSRHNENLMDEFMNVHVAPRLKLPNTSRWVGISDRVFSALSEDFMKPATVAVEQLLNETSVEVSVFSSQLDLVANSRSTSQWVESLKWAGIQHWQDTPRKALPISGMVEGDRKNYGNLAVYWIRRVGQLLPAENPRVGRELLRRVTNFDMHDILDYISDRS